MVNKNVDQLGFFYAASLVYAPCAMMELWKASAISTAESPSTDILTGWHSTRKESVDLLSAWHSTRKESVDLLSEWLSARTESVDLLSEWLSLNKSYYTEDLFKSWFPPHGNHGEGGIRSARSSPIDDWLAACDNTSQRGTWVWSGAPKTNKGRS